MKKKGKRKPSAARRQAEINKALKVLEPTMIPLLELFAVVDDVFTEEDAFTNEHIKQSLGRCFRAWKDTRSALDPQFDRNDYERRPRKVKESTSSPLAMASQNSSTDRKSISERKGNPKGRPVKRSAKKSARSARSD